MSEFGEAFPDTSQLKRDMSLGSSGDSSDDDEEVTMLRQLALGEKSIPQHVTGTGFIYHPIFAELKCEWDPAYPENPSRVLQPLARCTELGLVNRCKSLEIHYATEDQIMSKHTQDHVLLAQSTASMSMEELMAVSEKYDSWYANKATYEAALAAAGSTIRVVEHVVTEKLRNGFAMVRPPGHHAMEQEFNGYCTFNNVAVATQFALDGGVKRILIVDWDVHHGQGVQRMFYDDPRVLYFSIHRYEYGDFWPNLRESDYDFVGKGQGEGFNVNVPLNKTRMTNGDYMAVFNMLLLPLAYEFQPQLILISSGYDAAVGCPEFKPELVIVSNGLDSAIGDEKGEMLLTPAMYAHMTHRLMALAGGKVCVVLEGGYCIKSLAEGCALTLRSLLLDPCPMMPPLSEPSDSIITTILNVIKILRQHWKCFKHYENLERSQDCPFEEVNYMPPVENVEFSTPENRPEKFEIMGFYPVQDEKTQLHFSKLIDQLILETSLSVAQHKCCYVFDADMRAHRHLHDRGHPERPDRISRIYTVLMEWHLLRKCLTVASRLARKSELLWIHSENYIHEMVGTQKLSEDDLDSFPSRHAYPSVYLHQKSLHSALLSCGSLLNVVEAVLCGKSQSGAAIVRPPGHHAESHKAMGFCFFNNVAVAAKFAQYQFKLNRILILDWDVHHGNATQHQFYDDPSVLYISLHRFDNGAFFPGGQGGSMKNVGEGQGVGYNVNIAWNRGRMGDAEYISAFNHIVMPIAYQFAPELVLVSAGFDAAVGDPLGGYNVTPACYGHMTHMLKGLANGRVVLSLEGGYNLNSLSQSMAMCVSVLLGNPCPVLETQPPSERAASTIHDVLETHKHYWSCLKGSVRIPSVRRVDNQRWEIEKLKLDKSTRKQLLQHSAKQAEARKSRSDPSQDISSIGESSSDLTTDVPTTTALVSSSDSVLDQSASRAFESSATPGQDSSSTKTTTDQSDNSTVITLTNTSTTTTNTTTTTTDQTDSNVNADGGAGASLRLEVPDQVQEETPVTPVPSAVVGTSQLATTEAQSTTSQVQPVSPEGERSSETPAGDPGLSGVITSLQNLNVSESPRDSGAALDKPPSHELKPQNPQSLAAIPKSAGHTEPNDEGGDRPEEVFKSLIYAGSVDPEPLSIFAVDPRMASQEDIWRTKERARGGSAMSKSEDQETESKPEISGAQASTRGETVPSGAQVNTASSSGQPHTSGTAGVEGAGDKSSVRQAEETEESLLGACGGSSRPNTVQEFLAMQGAEQMYAVQPLPWCPHLPEVMPLPARGLSTRDPCSTCGDTSENWVCLTCYQVACSRFVNEHMLMHKLETDHNMTLSYSDLSVWCYACDSYVDNQALFPMKNEAHKKKFGESLPGM